MKRTIFTILFLLYTSIASANSFLNMDAPTIVLSVEGMDYTYDLDVFVQQKRKVWVPLGELWFWATPQTSVGNEIELLVEVEGEGELSFVLPPDGGEKDFWEGNNHILIRTKIVHSNCFSGGRFKID